MIVRSARKAHLLKLLATHPRELNLAPSFGKIMGFLAQFPYVGRDRNALQVQTISDSKKWVLEYKQYQNLRFSKTKSDFPKQIREF
jgi:hypothetical protein